MCPFLIVFFLFPLGYGWGYRGWGAWPRRRPMVSTIATGEPDLGWGVVGVLMWVVLILAVIWLIAALGWHR